MTSAQLIIHMGIHNLGLCEAAPHAIFVKNVCSALMRVITVSYSIFLYKCLFTKNSSYR